MRFPRYALRGASIAAAIASAPVLAEDGVQIYGTLNVDVESVEASGATEAATLPPGFLGATPTGVNVPRRTRVTSNSSNLGFRGTETIAPGLAAFFQVESAVNVDGGGSNIASRNTAVGMSGAWGSWRLGQWDTPYKTISGAVDPMYFTGIAYTGAIIGTPGFGVGPTTIGTPATSGDGKSFAAGPNASFERRQGNSIQYWSPAFSGLAARLAYSVDEAKTARVDPRILSASLEYDAGMFYLAYAHEDHRDYFGLDALVPAAQATPVNASGSSRDRGDKLIARVKLGGTQVGVIAETLRYEKDRGDAAPGAFSRYKRNALALTLLQKVGAAGTLRAIVAKASDGSCARFDGVGVRHVGARRAPGLARLQPYALEAHGPLRVLYPRLERRAGELPVRERRGTRRRSRLGEHRVSPRHAAYVLTAA